MQPPIAPPAPADSRRTLALAAAMTAYVLSFFHRFAPAAIAPDLAAAFSTTAASLGVLAGTYFWVYTVMQVPTGVLVDTLGPRRVLFAGALCAAIGSCGFGLAGSLGLALAGRALVGLGVSVTFISMLKMISVEFEERRFATIVGLAMLIGNSGSVLAGAPLTWLAQRAGWRAVFLGAALASLAVGAACWLLVRDHREGPPPRFDRRAICGGLLAVLKNRDTWPAVGANFGLAGSFFAFAGLWAAPFLTQVHGLSRAVASNHLSLYFASFAAACLLIGGASDRLRRRKPVLVAGALVYCGLWAFWLSGITAPLPVSYALFALMGVSTSCFTLTWACAKEVNPPPLAGMSTSVCNMGGFLAGAVLQPLVGWAIDLHWSGAMAGGARLYAPADFRPGLLLLAGAAFFGGLSALFVRETGCRNVWSAGALHTRLQ